MSNRLMEFPISLQSHPELRRRFQQAPETQGGIGGDGALVVEAAGVELDGDRGMLGIR
jgi:hypothetical protein